MVGLARRVGRPCRNFPRRFRPCCSRCSRQFMRGRSVVRARSRVLGALDRGALACAAVLMAYQYACFGSPFHIAYSSEQGYEGMQQGVFGVSAAEDDPAAAHSVRRLPRTAAARADAGGRADSALRAHASTEARSDRSAPSGHRRRRARAAIVATMIARLFHPAQRELRRTGKAAGRTVRGTRRRRFRFSASASRALWTIVPRPGRWVLAAALRVRRRDHAGRRVDDAAAAGEHPASGDGVPVAGVPRRRSRAEHADDGVGRRRRWIFARITSRGRRSISG